MRTGPLFRPGPRPPLEPVRGLLLCDRDGTIIENRPSYILSWPDVEFLPGSHAALDTAARAGLAIVIVSNQSPVGRGLMTEEECLALHDQVVDSLTAEGVPVAGSYLCPHRPDQGCACRKPEPGMLRLARQRFGAALPACFVGDSVEDMSAAVRAECHPLLVRTGRGAEQEAAVRAREELRGVTAVLDLAGAVRQVLDVLVHDPAGTR
ncbi:D-glycero-alpha-D-manno-heptose-1,7-bisphosphate 7-phosphatase [Streptomyces naphthomycinicus]|uniref:D-glycero-alpha-D-manno-heptose-1,7-bisphosphate 7-phosphatase n=1 Tax=Streptomyces naphthomycinicus TaxID=2872625 RepID=UPI001CEC99EE|nr:HAD-IIIA family hydrolase [Streptomyces sp. TML10]